MDLGVFVSPMPHGLHWRPWHVLGNLIQLGRFLKVHPRPSYDTTASIPYDSFPSSDIPAILISALKIAILYKGHVLFWSQNRIPTAVGVKAIR
jgi:hypothetical protein